MRAGPCDVSGHFSAPTAGLWKESQVRFSSLNLPLEEHHGCDQEQLQHTLDKPESMFQMSQTTTRHTTTNRLVLQGEFLNFQLRHKHPDVNRHPNTGANLSAPLQFLTFYTVSYAGRKGYFKDPRGLCSGEKRNLWMFLHPDAAWLEASNDFSFLF